MIVQDFSACTLKTKYKALYYFKTYKAKVKNQHERKKNQTDMVLSQSGGVFQNESLVPKFNLIKGSKCHMCAQLKQNHARLWRPGTRHH
jgi:hypothetical protein